MTLTKNLSNAKIHHIAVICSDYAKSKDFYTRILGFEVIREVLREHRQSYKLDLKVGDHSQIELFSFPNPPARTTSPEACGLRHLAFEVRNIEETVTYLRENHVEVEDIRVDEFTGKQFSFFRDPDDLPLEIYQA